MTLATTLVSPRRGYKHRMRGDAATVLAWLDTYISKPSPQLGRRGPVCPFVPVALSAGAVDCRFYYEIDGRNPDRLRAILLYELELLTQATVAVDGSGITLASTLVVLPDTDGSGWAAMDQIYSDLKDAAVERGLMIGQFHPACDERAARNPAFPVSRSPVPLFAIRRMAPHDVLFLHENPDWFAAYHHRFGDHWRHGRVRDGHLRLLYAAAARRHGVDAAIEHSPLHPTTRRAGVEGGLRSSPTRALSAPQSPSRRTFRCARPNDH